MPKVHRNFPSQKHRVQEQRAAWLGVGLLGVGGNELPVLGGVLVEQYFSTSALLMFWFA